MPANPELTGSAIVFVGSLNPAIFQPSWFVRQNLLTPEDADRVTEVKVVHSQLCQFESESFLVQVTPQKFWQACRIVFAVFLASCGSSPESPTAPTSPARNESANGAFIASAAVSPIYVGYGPKITPESAPQGNLTWEITVQATGNLRGTIQRIDARLRDRETGSMLGTSAHIGPFLNPRDGRDPNRVIDPLLETGKQSFTGFLENLGFIGRPAVLEIEVTVKDTSGATRAIVTTVPCEVFPTPIIRSPVAVTVRQNDVQSGCGFDSTHGYGLVIDVTWDPPPPGNHPVVDYTVAIADGAGTEIIWPFYAHTGGRTSLRVVRCGMHVPIGAEHGARVGVMATAYNQLSGFAVSRFDFQSCRDAGTPACQ